MHAASGKLSILTPQTKYFIMNEINYYVFQGLPMTNLPQKQFQSGSGYLGASAGRRPGAPPATLNGVPVTSIPGFDIDEDTIQRLGEGPISNSIFVQ